MLHVFSLGYAIQRNLVAECLHRLGIYALGYFRDDVFSAKVGVF